MADGVFGDHIPNVIKPVTEDYKYVTERAATQRPLTVGCLVLVTLLKH
jgi:hypothetical protein